MEEARKAEQGIETDEISKDHEAVVMILDGTTAYGKLKGMFPGDSMGFARRGMDRLFDRYLIGKISSVGLADEDIWANVAPYLDIVPPKQQELLAGFHRARNSIKDLAQKTVSLIQMSPTATRRATRNRENVTEEV